MTECIDCGEECYDDDVVFCDDCYDGPFCEDCMNAHPCCTDHTQDVTSNDDTPTELEPDTDVDFDLLSGGDDL